MPVDDWSRVPAGLFHHFQQCWSVRICDALNAGRLPDEFFALIHRHPAAADSSSDETNLYAALANRVVIHRTFGDIAAVVEIVSPGHKNSREALRTFVEPALDFLRHGVHLLVIDLLPPGLWDLDGVHGAILVFLSGAAYSVPQDRPLTLASYSAGLPVTAFVEPLAPGDALIDMPIFLGPEIYVDAPLEETYAATWAACPGPFREFVRGLGT